MEVREFVILNRNGKRIPATLRIPEGAVRGTALLLHGLGGWKDQSVIAQVAEQVAMEGYQSLTFNAADGSRGPDGTFFNQTTSGYLRDTEDVVDFLKKSAEHQSPLILVGHSVGGLVALRFASEHPKDIEILVLLAPAVSWKMMWWGQLPWLLAWLVQGKRKWPGPKGEDFYLGRGWIFDFFTFDGYRYARNVHVPVLVVSAGKDGTVARPREHALFVRRFEHATQSVVTGASHAFEGYEQEVAGIVALWLSSS